MANAYGPALAAAHRLAVEYLESLEQRPVAATATLAELRQRLGKPLPDTGMPAERVVEELAADATDGMNGSAGARFFGWVIGGAVPASLAADWLTAAWDQNAAIYACSPAASVIEEVAGEWLKDLLGLPATASFGFVTGCQAAHTTGLAAARHHLLANRGWDVEEQGLFGAPRIRVLTSTERHGTVERALRWLGFGTQAMEHLPCGEDGRLPAVTLQEALAKQPQTPTIVVLQAGDLNLGAFDDFATLIPMAHAAGAWVHVDGAFGLWANASPRYRHLLAGVALADSWATDGHKWLNVPYDSGFAFVARPEAHSASVSHRAPYLVFEETARDQIDWNPEWSRRARAIPTYAAIREMGREGIAQMVERCCMAAEQLVEGMGALPGVEVLARPIVNQGLVRFLDPRPGATTADHDRRTDAVIQSIVKEGEALFGGSSWRGMRVMRVSVCNWQTGETDIRRTVAAVERALRRSI